jgi:8-oxo-dGTP pyrophosphatase MutT (NUDIX family)
MRPVAEARQAVRGVLIDQKGAVFLMRLHAPKWREAWWYTPGGGIDAGEDDLTALRRELAEEIGLDLPKEMIGPPLWRRKFSYDGRGGTFHQQETYYLVEIDRFDPAWCGDGDPAVGMVPAEPRWWTSSELREAADPVAPGSLADLLDQLHVDGPPRSVVDL